MAVSSAPTLYQNARRKNAIRNILRKNDATSKNLLCVYFARFVALVVGTLVNSAAKTSGIINTNIALEATMTE